jgi:tetratricopeptide (TPR) repeat protein
VLRENHNNALAWHGWKLSMTASFIEGLEQQIATLHEEMADPEYFRRSAELRAADKRMLSEYEQQLAALLEDRARLDELSNRDWQKHQKDLELRIDYERRSYEDRRDRELGLRLMRVHELQKLNFLTLNDAFPYFRRGSLYSADRQYGWAIADYTEAIRIDLFHAEAYYNRGVAHRELGNDVKAAADFAKAKELGYEPDDE